MSLSSLDSVAKEGNTEFLLNLEDVMVIMITHDDNVECLKSLVKQFTLINFQKINNVVLC